MGVFKQSVVFCTGTGGYDAEAKAGFVYEKFKKASGSMEARRFLSWTGVR